MLAPWALPLGPAVTRAGCGVEHEFQVLDERDRQVDFRTLLGPLTAGLVPRDPADPRAVRLPHGPALTADGWEAELASAPHPPSAAGLAALTASLAIARRQLGERLPDGLRLAGFSTQVNVSVPDDRVVHLGKLVAAYCLPAIDGVVGPVPRTGYAVRPRRGRLEVGTDFLDPVQTLLAVAMLAGCVRALERGERPPERRASALTPSREKFGYFVPPHGLAPLRSTTIHWIDDAVRSLGLPSVVERSTTSRYAELAQAPSTERSPALVGPRKRGRLTFACTLLTWSHAVWTVTDGASGRQRHAVVPTSLERDFLRLVDAGDLDDAARAILSSRRRRVLLTYVQTLQAGWWSDVRPGALVPAERGSDGEPVRVSRRLARRDWRRHRQELLAAR